MSDPSKYSSQNGFSFWCRSPTPPVHCSQNGFDYFVYVGVLAMSGGGSEVLVGGHVGGTGHDL